MISSERGELISGARDAYIEYIRRLEARLRERESTAVDHKLIRSERQRLETEAALTKMEQTLGRRVGWCRSRAARRHKFPPNKEQWRAYKREYWDWAVARHAEQYRTLRGLAC